MENRIEWRYWSCRKHCKCRKQWELFVSADTTASSKPSDSEPITKISWKVIDYGGSPYFHLYVTLNNKADYYVGYFYGENFETGEFIDTPANVLTAASAEWAGMGELFYIYQKSETELTLMNHYVSYMTALFLAGWTGAVN